MGTCGISMKVMENLPPNSAYVQSTVILFRKLVSYVNHISLTFIKS